MARRRHETDLDKHREGVAAKQLSASLHNELSPLSPYRLPGQYSQLDYALVDNQGIVHCLVEIKVRNTARSKYRTLMLSLSKWRTLVLTAQAFVHVDVMLAVAWTDALGVLSVSDYVARGDMFTVAWGGRTKATRDDGDIEPVVQVPVDRFDVLWSPVSS